MNQQHRESSTEAIAHQTRLAPETVEHLRRRIVALQAEIARLKEAGDDLDEAIDQEANIQ
jgi:uncharacterized small protein (DUF1192 family)